MDPVLDKPGKKFMFDLNDFDEDALRRRAEAARRPVFGQAEMEASRQTGFEEGRLAGLSEAINSQEAQLRDLTQQLVMAADRLAQDESDRLATFIDQAALVTVQALHRALPALLDLFAADQIAGFVSQVMAEQAKGQTITIAVNPAREAAIRDRMDAMTLTLRRNQAWTIVPDPALHDLQCRMEWTGGGAEWTPDRVAARVLETITSHLPDRLKPHTRDAVAVPDQTPHTVSDNGDAA